MALSATRHRRPSASDPSSSTSSNYSKLDKEAESKSSSKGERDGGLKWQFAFFSLAVLRYMSATSNIIHDCDEVFNYWEPLHFLLYKSGFQTWEYRWKNRIFTLGFWTWGLCKCHVQFESAFFCNGFSSKCLEYTVLVSVWVVVGFGLRVYAYAMYYLD